MAPILRIFKAALAALAGVVYAWFAGVRNAPEVKRRKRARAARRRR